VSHSRPGTPDAPDDDQVPIFGTWRGIYSAAIACALAAMALIAMFSSWRF